MTDSEDEVDILGELPSPAVSSYSDLFKCDYTIHPRWLLDSASTDDILLDSGAESGDDRSHRGSATPAAAVHWSDAEKNTLHRGVEIYGQDPNRLSTFVGSKSASDVRLFVETEYGVTLDSGLAVDSICEYGDVLAENEIPTSTEEVVCDKSPSDPIIEQVCKTSDVDRLLFGIPKKTPTKRTALEKYSGSSDLADDGRLYIDLDRLHPAKRKNRRPKFEPTVSSSKSRNISRLLKKRKDIKTVKRKSKASSSSTINILPPKRTSLMQIVMGSGQALPLSEGEQVIKLEKCVNAEAESDIEIDIDSDVDEPKNQKKIEPKNSPVSGVELEPIEESFKTEVCDAKSSTDRKLIDVPDSLREILESFDTPQTEYPIVDNEISELEKILIPDFFEGKTSKTPERYALIRSHIVGCWRQCRPSYLTKTATRQGLKNGGNVNCIGKIHTVLEQIGAINFGCDQTNYTRPLIELLYPSSSMQQHLPITEFAGGDFGKHEMLRQRKKKITVDGNGGYTITHTKSGEFYQVISEPKQQQQHRSGKKKPVNLIYCKMYSDENPSPYFVQLSLSALILMDVHSYSSRAEVMGLLGGHKLNDNILTVEKYVPCDSLEDSGTHCDMCPVSQSAATESLCASGYDTIGWHHSHPLFPPEPSAQDIVSQADFQAAFSPEPFLALIVSPYWPPGRTSSRFRCFVTKRDPSGGDYQEPYLLKTHLRCDLSTRRDVEVLLAAVDEIRAKNVSSLGHFVVDMNDVCGGGGGDANLTHLEKCVSSLKHHLSTCDLQITPEISSSVIDGICNIFKNQ